MPGITSLPLFILVVCTVSATEFTAPTEWRLVNTNQVAEWTQAWRTRTSPDLKVWEGVVADRKRREVRLLAESVGHTEGVTTEFLLIGPASDRAYESAAVAIAKPGDVVRAMESIGIPRGGGVGSRPFRFWPVGERVDIFARLLSADGEAGRETPLREWIRDAESEEPLLGEGGLVFTGGRWDGECCLSDKEAPGAIISLYNEGGTIFDVPAQADQGAVYGRLTLARSFLFGELYEIILRPRLPQDGDLRVLSLDISIKLEVEGGFACRCENARGERLFEGVLPDLMAWLIKQERSGRECFVRLALDDNLKLSQAVELARVFDMLDGHGIKLDGKPEAGLYPKAFLPREKWREREGRVPQPYEVRVTRDGDGTLRKRMVFIEEDWSGPGLDPALTPREYPFEKWSELPALVLRAGGPDCKVRMLFVFAPANEPLGFFMPGVRMLAERLPLVYVFAE